MLTTSFLAAAAIMVSWHEGAGAGIGAVAGIHVVAAPPLPPVNSPGKKRTKKPAKSSGKTSGKSSSAQATGGSKNPATAKPAAVRQRLVGAIVATPYGTVQVRVDLVGGRLVDVQPVKLTDANDRSRMISAGAAPILRSEALAAQSAKIDTVSGATYTSEGYRDSLQAILDQAQR